MTTTTTEIVSIPEPQMYCPVFHEETKQYHDVLLPKWTCIYCPCTQKTYDTRVKIYSHFRTKVHKEWVQSKNKLETSDSTHIHELDSTNKDLIRQIKLYKILNHQLDEEKQLMKKLLQKTEQLLKKSEEEVARWKASVVSPTEEPNSMMEYYDANSVFD
jgi:hypothetical protein